MDCIHSMCIGVALLLGGCGGVQHRRVAEPLALPGGNPETMCERENWYELVPAQVTAEAAIAGAQVNEFYFKEYRGLGVFRLNRDKPEQLPDLWRSLNEPALERQHQAWIDPVDSANRRTIYWAVGGLVGLFGGLGTAAAIQKDSKAGAVALGITGLAVGLVGAVGALASQPPARDQLEADAHRQLFFDDEDDRSAVERGVDRLNAQVRQQCRARAGEPRTASRP